MLLLRAKSDSDMRLWKESIDTSSMWDVVQRAWAFQDSAAADISARLTDSADASAGVDDTNMTPQLIQLLDTPAPLEVQSTVAAAPPAGRASAPARNAGRRRQTKRAAAAARPPSPAGAARRNRSRADTAAGDGDGGWPCAGGLDELCNI